MRGDVLPLLFVQKNPQINAQRYIEDRAAGNTRASGVGLASETAEKIAKSIRSEASPITLPIPALSNIFVTLLPTVFFE